MYMNQAELWYVRSAKCKWLFVITRYWWLYAHKLINSLQNLVNEYSVDRLSVD